MRIKVGRVVDTDKDINLADLSPIDRIITSATNAYHNTSMYKRRYAESEEKKEEQRRRIRETLTDNLLAVVTPEMEANKTLASRHDECHALLLKIPYRFKGFLEEVLQAHEFDAYSITIIPPSRSIAKFCNTPFLLYVENKGGE